VPGARTEKVAFPLWWSDFRGPNPNNEGECPVSKEEIVEYLMGCVQSLHIDPEWRSTQSDLSFLARREIEANTYWLWSIKVKAQDWYLFVAVGPSPLADEIGVSRTWMGADNNHECLGRDDYLDAIHHHEI
jgi:hypothetical protein